MERILGWVVPLLLVAGQASATVMETWAELSLQFTNFGQATVTDTTVGLSTVTTSPDGQLQSLTLPSDLDLSLNSVIPITDPLVSNGGIVEVRLTGLRALGGVIGNIPAAVASSAALTPGTIPATGAVRLCLFPNGCPSNPLDLIVNGTDMGLPVGVGVGGLVTAGGTGTVMVSLVGAPYTVGTVTGFARTAGGGLESFMTAGFAHGPLSNTGTTGLTGGELQIVTANQTSATGLGTINDTSGSFVRLLVHFVPEPGLAVLFCSGAVGMGVIGRKRIRQ